jgi:hypothetical protein
MKKNISRNPLWPDWYNGKKIDEVQFGRAFLEQWPLKCVNGTLYTLDGPVEDESEIKQRILENIEEYVTSGLSKKVTNILETIKLLAFSDPFPIEQDCIQKKTTLTKEALIHARDLDYIGKRTFLGNYSLTKEEFSKLKKQADHGYMMDVENLRLKEELSTAKKEAIHWSNKYHDLWYDVKPYLDALHRAPELVRGFLEKILAPKQERTMNVPQRNRKRGQDMEL